MTESAKVFRRYTELGSLLDMLQHQAITLLPMSSWDDKNDKLMMKTYAESMKLKTLLALCLTSRGETYHHWKVFTEKSNGVCIHFKQNGFNKAMHHANVKVRKMQYLKLDKLNPQDHRLQDLPFLKRFGYGDEGEYRAVYESKDSEDELKRVDIDLNIIERITLNPWMPTDIFETVRSIIKKLHMSAQFDVTHSSLIDNRRWREFAKHYENASRV
jgi:hypothetical protein